MLDRVLSASYFRLAPLLVAAPRWYVGQREPVIVYQMGKVGSTSVQRSLLRYGIRSYHTHDLGDLTGSSVGRQRRVIARRLHQVLHDDRHPRVKVITLVREPVARNVSAFFQTLPNPSAISTPTEVLQQRFIETYKHDLPLRWFDRKFLPNVGVDVFAEPFDSSRGWHVIDAGRIAVLTLKLEVDDEVKAEAIGSFVDRDDFALHRDNEASAKPVADAYRRFKKTLQLPPDLLDRIIDAKYTRHFYSDTERDQMRERWGDRA